MDIDEILTIINEVSERFFEEDFKLYDRIARLVPGISDYYIRFLSIVPQLNEQGFDIDPRGVIGQLDSLTNAIEKRNRIEIYDSLIEEIADTLMFIKGLFDEG